jgi:hypothetical protein
MMAPQGADARRLDAEPWGERQGGDPAGVSVARGRLRRAVLRAEQGGNKAPFDLEALRKKINNEEYLYGAIQRIAQVLSTELLKVSQGSIYHERKRRK